jgi:hypothetical protein
MQTRHFVFTSDGKIREFSPEQAALVAAGAGTLPEFADSTVRYLQLTLEDNDVDAEMKVQTSGANIQFDGEGKIAQAGPAVDAEPITRFEHDAVVQWALRDIPAVRPVFH